MDQTRLTRLAQLKSLLDTLPNIYNQSQRFQVDPGEVNDYLHWCRVSGRLEGWEYIK
jgi:hypothetical protein